MNESQITEIEISDELAEAFRAVRADKASKVRRSAPLRRQGNNPRTRKA